MFVCLFQSLEDFADDDDEYVDDRGYEEDNEDDQDFLNEYKNEKRPVEKKESGKYTYQNKPFRDKNPFVEGIDGIS